MSLNKAIDGPILLVEDDPDDQEMMREILNSLGVKNELVVFYNGHDVLKFLRETSEQPFLILSDINMPKLNGLELRKEINSEQSLKQKSIPFVFLSTTDSRQIVLEAYDLTVQGFFKKPNSYKEFKEMLKMIIDYWRFCKHPNN